MQTAKTLRLKTASEQYGVIHALNYYSVPRKDGSRGLQRGKIRDTRTGAIIWFLGPRCISDWSEFQLGSECVYDIEPNDRVHNEYCAINIEIIY